MTVSAEDVKLRKPGNHARNAIGFFIGFGCGLVIVLLFVCCWMYFETCALCQRSKKEKQYSPPPETGKSDE
eukprot:CAMPEP_0197041392 /NCGR_PEP_ID=MMETSP1384-20130603/17938_1 /TAXON_ID=29189 /ORGANISM="Ammonia sp." /LENGTH=70 /DNA_ID=CAMNT_0042472295 /DNA_START=189 /DNA_END=401 /DNA_ORIENTATION=+